MKMRKFVVGLVASALVVASMATTVFAAKSPTTDNVTPTPTVAPSTSGGSSSSGSSKSSGGSSSSSSSTKSNAAVFASNITGEVIKYDGVDIEIHPAVLKQLSDSIIASAKALGTGGILKAVDCEDSANPNGKGVLYNDTITVRFRSSAFKAGMKITVLHQPDGSSDWEKIPPDSVSDGECVVTFTSLSPVVFTAEGVSDKTGETAPVLPIAAAICLAGVVFFGTKIRFAK